MASRSNQLLSALFLVLALIFSTVAKPNSQSVYAQPSKPLVMVIVDSSIYDAIKPSLNQYSIDVEDSGFSVNVTETAKLTDKTPSGIRAHLQLARSQGLEGALLVGDVPEAWFKVEDHKFPTDMYYMDLDGSWFDLNRDGIFDARGGDLSPEIWVGRIKVSTLSGDQVSLINGYFVKNHAYRTGAMTIPWWRSLIYIDDEGGVSNRQDAVTSLGYVTTDETAVTDPRATNTTDYKNRLKDSRGYQWLYLMSHGQTGKHDFYVPEMKTGSPEYEGSIYSSDYEAINPRIVFYQFFTCSASRYTDQEYLAGSVVFRTSWGLAAIGSTDDIYSYSTDSFFRSLSDRESIGGAFRQWLGNAVSQHKFDYFTDSRYQILFNAVTIIGDPTLTSIIENHDVAVTSLEVSVENSSSVETLFITATAENHGEFTEKVSLEISYDSRRVFKVDLILPVGESSTVTFSPVDSYQFIWGTHTQHLVEAKVSIASGEFHLSDNVGTTYFEGKNIENPQPFQLPPLILAIIANVAFGLIGWSLLRQFMSERPRLLVYLTKMHKFITKRSTH